MIAYKDGREIKSRKNKDKIKIEGKKRNETYVVRGFIDGHKIDFIKNRIAFDLEWNSKDQTFDRDLYAARTFYECGIMSAAVLLTRSASLAPLFGENQNRVDMNDFKAKFGASTTWMGKLKYRLDAGRGGGCPVLALGIKPAHSYQILRTGKQLIRYYGKPSLISAKPPRKRRPMLARND